MITAALVILALAIFTMNNLPSPKTTPAPVALAHVGNSFQFLLRAPLARAAMLFGPEGERSWAGEDWNPQFLYPQPGRDIQGAVFTVQQGQRKSIWITTVFDASNGRMQYVSFVPNVSVSTVDVQLRSVDASTTGVEVTYVRTALDATVNAEVEGLGRSDRQKGILWQEAIETYLRKGPGQ
ncbi:MAG: hypothetical protein ABSD75_20935 [Terriglobales bacterium]|jgi:hypothetical protein